MKLLRKKEDNSIEKLENEAGTAVSARMFTNKLSLIHI